MLLLLVPFAAAHSSAAPHLHAEASPLPPLIVGAWVVLAAAWWHRASKAT